MTLTLLPASVILTMAKILLVDDDRNLVDVFQTALQNAGYTVIAVYDGKSALEKANTERPDLILLDQVLPDITGIDVLKTIKAGALKDTPVVMVSNFGQNELVQEALNAGAIDYILKYQIASQDLTSKVKQLLGDPAKSEGG